jgi:hypothetical protein
MGNPAITTIVGKCGIDTASPVTKGFEFIREDLKAVRTITRRTGMRGTFSEIVEGSRVTQIACSGPIALEPGVTELNNLLPHIMGAAGQVGTPAGKTTFALGSTFSDLYVTIDRGSKVHTYYPAKIARATFRASEGRPMELELQIEAGAETEANAGSYPSITLATDDFFVFSDGVFTLGGSARELKSFELTVENRILTDRYMNSLTRAKFPFTGRTISLNCLVPYTDTDTALYNQAVTGAAASIVLTNGNLSLQFDIGRFQVPGETPTNQAKYGENMLSLTGQCLKTGSTDELSTILDLTP